MHTIRRIAAACAALAALLATAAAPASADQRGDVVLVNLTAEWCPNCQVLDPRLDAAVARFDGDEAPRRIILDFTSRDTIARAYEAVNGTLYAGVYADYAGVTGIGVLVAADSGETIECLTAQMTTDVIAMQIAAARDIARTQPIGRRGQGSAMCPPPNRNVRVDG